MNFLKYSNENQVNIIPQDSFQELTKDVFNVIATNLCKSLGPLGSSATILDGMLTEATKDGYSILMKYRFHNRYKNMIYNLIKAPCTKMNNTVGDGTTTAIALTNALYQAFSDEKIQKKIKDLFRLPRDFIKCLDSAVAALQSHVKLMAKQLNPTDYDTVYNIAYVVSNGNEEVSSEIAKLYSENKSPYIKQKDSPTNQSYISTSEGFEYPCTLIDILFASNDDNSVVIKNPAIMHFDHKIETDTFKYIIQINDVMRAMGKPLIIIAPQYDSYMLDTVAAVNIKKEQMKYGNTNIILAQYNVGKVVQYQTEDLCAVLKNRIITVEMDNRIQLLWTTDVDTFVENATEDQEYDFYGIIGEASEVMLSLSGEGMFKAVEGIENDPHYIRTLNNARQDLADVLKKTDDEKLSFSAKIYDANARVLRLEMKTFIYYIGANSALQKQILWDSVDDVIKCLRSATKYGIVPGSQLALMKCCKDLIADSEGSPASFILKMIFVSLVSVYERVLNGPDGTGLYKFLQARYPDRTADELNSKVADYITESIEKQQVFDLEALQYNADIITSVETDIMVLSVATELAKVLISGNQCIFIDSDLNGTHQASVEEYM